MKPFALAWFAALFLFPGAALCAEQATEEKAVMRVVQQLFDAMEAHDPALAASTALSDARTLRAKDGKADMVEFAKFVSAVGSAKDAWAERIMNPTVLIDKSVATVWGRFEFRLNGRVHHCGIDSFSLIKTGVKTGEGWKIAYIADTHENPGPDGACH